MESSRAEITPEQLATMVRSSLESYRTIQATYEVESYAIPGRGPIGSKLSTEPSFSFVMYQLSTPERSLFKEEFKYPGTNYITKRSTLLITPKYAKNLDEKLDETGATVKAHGQSQKRGSEPDFAETKPGTFEVAMFDDLLFRPQKYEHSVVTRDEQTGYFIIEYTQPQNIYESVVLIDPARGYSIIRSDFISDGELRSRTECSDFRLVDGDKWVPFKYSRESIVISRDAEGNKQYRRTVARYRVKSAKVNSPISKEDIDIKFPYGTIVDDEISGSSYRVGLFRLLFPLH